MLFILDFCPAFMSKWSMQSFVNGGYLKQLSASGKKLSPE
ncbi:hypothetical protein FM120_23120 [Sphingobacterium faecium PCAi_F2.5]|nr:hypothetical protein FM120_23120 [Sphingobacterium faecium PCAi_F2.5]